MVMVMDDRIICKQLPHRSILADQGGMGRRKAWGEERQAGVSGPSASTAVEQRDDGRDGALDLVLRGGGGVLPLEHGHPGNPFQELGIGHLQQRRAGR